MRAIWTCLPLLPPGLLSWTKRNTNPRFRLWIREHLGGSYKSIPNQIKSVPDGRRFRIGPDPMYWAIFAGLAYEPEATEIIRRLLRKEDIVFDIGANFGWYTTLFAQLVPKGQVHAFEPVPSTFARLQDSLALNRAHGNVTAVPMAISDSAGSCSIFIMEGKSGLSSLAPVAGQVGATIEVPTQTLDEYVRRCGLPRINFLKCDAEGAEFFVLKGADKLLRSADAPILFLELNDQSFGAMGYTCRDVRQFLLDHGYDHFYDIASCQHLRRLQTETSFAAAAGALCCKGDQIADRLAEKSVKID